MGFQHLVFDPDSVFLVTGGAGFIGSNLCEAILNLGYRVRCLDDLSTGKKEHVEMFADNPNYTFIRGDIRDLETCKKACEGADYVLFGHTHRALITQEGGVTFINPGSLRYKGTYCYANAENGKLYSVIVDLNS